MIYELKDEGAAAPPPKLQRRRLKVEFTLPCTEDEAKAIEGDLAHGNASLLQDILLAHVGPARVSSCHIKIDGRKVSIPPWYKHKSQ